MNIQRGIRSGIIGAFFPIFQKKKMVRVVQKKKYWLEILAS